MTVAPVALLSAAYVEPILMSMKRDMDLVRQILVQIEEHEYGRAPRNLTIDGHTKEYIGYHVYLMGQAGLLQVSDVTGFGDASPVAIPRSMTWAGHDFLNAARSDTVWNRAKTQLGVQWVSVPFDILKALLFKLVGQTVGSDI